MAETFTIGELAASITGDNERAMRALLREAGARLDVYRVDPTETVGRQAVVDLFALRAGDRVGRKCAEVLKRGPGAVNG